MSPTHAHTRKISFRQALNGIYFDFEGRIEEEPVLVGLLYRRTDDGGWGWVVEQFVLDRVFAAVDAESQGECTYVELDELVPRLSAMADERRSPLISWSEYDWQVAKRISGGLAFRYRNALPTVKPWKNKLRDNDLVDFEPGQPNSLANYERMIGYDRPPEGFDVGDSIAYIRSRNSITPGAQKRWRTILEHNRHDLMGMRDVVLSCHAVPGAAIPS